VTVREDGIVLSLFFINGMVLARVVEDLPLLDVVIT
jgi:sRNA-binding regulator protein Hfq